MRRANYEIEGRCVCVSVGVSVCRGKKRTGAGGWMSSVRIEAAGPYFMKLESRLTGYVESESRQISGQLSCLEPGANQHSRLAPR